MSQFAIFTTADGTNFTATVFSLPAGLAAGQAERGLCFDSTNNACFATKETGPVIHYIGFNLGTGTATWLGDFTAGQAWAGISVAYLTAFTTNTLRVLAVSMTMAAAPQAFINCRSMTSATPMPHPFHQFRLSDSRWGERQ